MRKERLLTSEVNQLGVIMVKSGLHLKEIFTKLDDVIISGVQLFLKLGFSQVVKRSRSIQEVS